MTYLNIAKKYLPPPVLERYIRNAQNLGYSVLKRRNKENDIADVIYGSFSWSETPEGHDYWQEITKKYGEFL
jgi:hypothetical protein